MSICSSERYSFSSPFSSRPSWSLSHSSYSAAGLVLSPSPLLSLSYSSNCCPFDMVSSLRRSSTQWSSVVVAQWYSAEGRTVEPILPSHALRPPTNGARRFAHHPPSGLVRQISSDVYGCFGAGTQGAVELHYFSRVALGVRHSKSPASLQGPSTEAVCYAA